MTDSLTDRAKKLASQPISTGVISGGATQAANDLAEYSAMIFTLCNEIERLDQLIEYLRAEETRLEFWNEQKVNRLKKRLSKLEETK